MEKNLIRIIQLFVFVITCTLFVPGLSHAEIKAGSTNLTIFGGGFIFDHETDFAQPTTHADMDNRPTAGFGIGYNFTKHIGIEGVGNYIWGKFDSEAKHDISKRSVPTYLLHLDLLYHFMPDEKLVPYVALGGGGIMYNPRDKALDRQRDCSLNYGLGVKYFMSPAVALRADVRHVFGFSHNSSDINNNLLYNLGLTLAFGGGEKAKEEAAAPPAPAPQPEPQVEAAPPAPEPAPAPVPVPAPSEVEKSIVEKGRATLNIQFDTNKAVVKEKYNKELSDFADVMKKYPDLKVTIEGHTDNVGNAAANKKLSQKRADSVKNYLVTKFGIDASRLNAVGYGPTRPIASNATKEGRQKNRRVEAAVEYEKK